MFITVLVAATVMQSKVEAVPLTGSELIVRVAGIEDYRNFIGRYFIVDKRFAIRQHKIPAKLIENARKRVADTSRVLTRKQIDSAQWTARHTADDVINDVLIAQWKLDGYLLTVAESGSGVFYLIEGNVTEPLQVEEFAEDFIDEQIDVWLKQHPQTLDKRTHYLREEGLNFFVDTVFRGVDLVPVEGKEGHETIEGEQRWDTTIYVATDGKSVILVTGSPAIGPPPVGGRATGTLPGDPHSCRFIEKVPELPRG